MSRRKFRPSWWEAYFYGTVNNIPPAESLAQYMHFISIHNSLPDAGLYWFPGICKDSVEIAASLWVFWTLLLSDRVQLLAALYVLAASITAESIRVWAI